SGDTPQAARTTRGTRARSGRFLVDDRGPGRVACRGRSLQISRTQDPDTVVWERMPSLMDTTAALPAVFRWLPDWIEPVEAGRLLETLLVEIPWEDHAVTIAGRKVPVPRRVAYFGPFSYTYSGIVHPARALPPVIATLRDRIQDVTARPFNTVLMNLYRSGIDSVSWHSDDDYPHGGHPAVASLSLGETRRFRIAH